MHDDRSQEPISRGQGQTIINLINAQNQKFDAIHDRLENIETDVNQLKEDVSTIKSVYNLPNEPTPRKRR